MTMVTSCHLMYFNRGGGVVSFFPSRGSISWGPCAYTQSLKSLTYFAILAMRCDDLPGSSVTHLSYGKYFTNLDLLCKNGEGFNLYSLTAITEALLEEVREHEKHFRG